MTLFVLGILVGLLLPALATALVVLLLRPREPESRAVREAREAAGKGW